MSKDGNPDYDTLKGARLAMWRELYAQLENIDTYFREGYRTLTDKQLQNYERILQEFDEFLFKKAGWVWVQIGIHDWEARSKEWLEANKASVTAVLHGNIHGWRLN